MLWGIVTWVDEPTKGEIAWKFKWHQQHLLPSENKLDVDQVEVDAGDLIAMDAL